MQVQINACKTNIIVKYYYTSVLQLPFKGYDGY